MLSEELKARNLFAIEKPSKKEIAMSVLEETCDNLVIAMATIERMGLFSREDIEDYVIAYLEAYEKRYYTMDEDAFDRHLKRIMSGRR